MGYRDVVFQPPRSWLAFPITGNSLVQLPINVMIYLSRPYKKIESHNILSCNKTADVLSSCHPFLPHSLSKRQQVASSRVLLIIIVPSAYRSWFRSIDFQFFNCNIRPHHPIDFARQDNFLPRLLLVYRSCSRCGHEPITLKDQWVTGIWYPQSFPFGW